MPEIQQTQQPDTALATNGGFRRIGRILRFVAVDAWDREFGDQAAIIAFYGMLSLFPTLLVVLVVTVNFGADPEVFQNWVEFSSRFAPEALTEWISVYLQDLVESANVGVFSAGFLTGVWFATAAFNAVLSEVRFAYMLGSKPTWKTRAYSLLLMFYTLIAGFLAFQAVAFGWPLIKIVLDNTTAPIALVATALQLFRWFVVLFFAYSIAFLIYYMACGDEYSKRQHTWGAIAFALLWAGITRFLVVYFQNFGRYQEVFGAIGAMIVTMIWMYVMAYALLFGAGLNRALIERPNKRT